MINCCNTQTVILSLVLILIISIVLSLWLIPHHYGPESTTWILGVFAIITPILAAICVHADIVFMQGGKVVDVFAAIFVSLWIGLLRSSQLLPAEDTAWLYTGKLTALMYCGLAIFAVFMTIVTNIRLRSALMHMIPTILDSNTVTTIDRAVQTVDEIEMADMVCGYYLLSLRILVTNPLQLAVYDQHSTHDSPEDHDRGIHFRHLYLETNNQPSPRLRRHFNFPHSSDLEANNSILPLH
ncbi:hypothetical protein P692DRAFT_20882754 [Suillus brevipes Sb2]|nr:hypothetical protein P692DRAFT_20882754 [Suillus brevipes Sb2]